MNAVIDRAAVDAGREPGAVRRLLNINGSFTGRVGAAAGPARGVGGAARRAGPRRGHERVRARRRPRRRAHAAHLRRGGRARRPRARGGRAGRRPASDGRGRRRPSVAPPSARHRPGAPAPGDGDHLVAIHDHLRSELAQVQDLVEQVARGHVDVAAARSLVSTMTLRQNDWTLGTYCESYCRVVTMHHTIEDSSMYPRLRAAEPSLGPALDRMLEEHHEIAGLLEDVDRALVGMVGGGRDRRRARGRRPARRRPARPPLLRGGPARRAAQPALDRALSARPQRSIRYRYQEVRRCAACRVSEMCTWSRCRSVLEHFLRDRHDELR